MVKGSSLPDVGTIYVNLCKKPNCGYVCLTYALVLLIGLVTSNWYVAYGGLHEGEACIRRVLHGPQRPLVPRSCVCPRKCRCYYWAATVITITIVIIIVVKCC